MKIRIQVWETPEMKFHDKDEPFYGNGKGQYWYEGEKIIKKDVLMTTAEHKDYLVSLEEQERRENEAE